MEIFRNVRNYSYRAGLAFCLLITAFLPRITAVEEEKTFSVRDIPLFIEQDSDIVTRIHDMEIRDNLHINFHHKRALHRELKKRAEGGMAQSNEYKIVGMPSDMVSAAFLVIGSDTKGEKVIMDTGSHLPVLALPESIQGENAFIPLDEESLKKLKKNSFEWVYKCPAFFMKGFSCGKERYGSGGVNSVIVQGRFGFREPTEKDFEKNKEYYDDGNTSLQAMSGNAARIKGGVGADGFVNTAILFQLNTIYGQSPLGILGLSFGKNGFDVNPFLTALDLKKKNFMFQSTNSKVHEGKQDISIKFGVDYNNDDYHWTEFTGYYKLFSMFNLYSVGAQRGAYRRADDPIFDDIKASNVIFDSGTNVLVLPKSIIKNLVSDLIGSMSDKVDLKKLDQQGKSYQLCWEAGNGVKMLIRLKEFALEVDLDLIGIYRIKKGGVVTTCNYILEDSFGVVPVGFSLWHMFDVIWDSDFKKVGFKPGQQCENNKCKILEYN